MRFVAVVSSLSNCGKYYNCLLIPVACIRTSRFFMAVTQFVLQVAEMYKNQQNSVKVSGTDPDPEDFY